MGIRGIKDTSETKTTSQRAEAADICGQDLLVIQESNYQMISEQPSEGVTAERCAAEVMETIPLVMQFLRAQVRSQNSPDLLSVPQFRALAFLDRHPGASLSDVAEHLGVTRATASAITERLVQRQFVDRSERPGERRHVVLKLTEAGSEYLQQIRHTTHGKIAKMFASLSEGQMLRILEGLAVLSDAIEGVASQQSS